MATGADLESPRERANTMYTRQGKRTWTVLSRLQALFPNAPPRPLTAAALHSTQYGSALPSPLPGKTNSPAQPKTLKVRIITWNMHDSVPKGDLEELLGKVPLWSQSSSCASGSFPNLTINAVHPYHLVVVAGQECPSLSGIPMGLGAGFKLIDKDKDNQKARARDDENEKPRSKYREREKDDAPKSRKNPEEPHDTPSGWTSMIEDWLCHGGGAGLRTSSPTVADVGFPKPLSPRIPSKEPRKGPYQLLVKERMMGIYLAVYIHREIRPLVRGTSKSAVTAGLIGGRVGNKGGVGITVNLDGTTLLFLNAHLAAHEGKVNHRLANLAKIKAELSVDDFLAHDDPRVMAEDLTDKFDYAFICGDLNFRLDISRLHADWLLSRRDYAQALAFDQLNNLMRSGQAFVGFKEAAIDFPPTFKYDVLRTSKRAKQRRSKLDRRRHLTDKETRLTEVEEKELEELEKEVADEECEGGEEAASMASSIWTSVHSKAGTDVDDEDDFFHTYPSSQTMNTSASKVSVVAVTAAHKAKAKWLSMLSKSSAPVKLLKTKQDEKAKKSHATASSVDVVSGGLRVPFPSGRALSLDAVDKTLDRPPPIILVNADVPNDEDDVGDDKGVYDTSHKKRVPSWCDRILWKSTVVPDLEIEEEGMLESYTRPRNRMGQFFANAFRPLSARVRRDSLASIATADSHDESAPSSPDIQEASVPFSRFVQPPERHGTLSHSKSIEQFAVSPLKTPARSTDLGLRRSNSVTLAPLVPTPLVLERPTRKVSASAGLPSVAPGASSGINIPSAPAASSRWRFLSSFLSHNPSQSNTSIELPATGDHVTPSVPRKGDVVCLSYNTLDDRGMRRLEGRSDHRPVIGSYVIYL